MNDQTYRERRPIQGLARHLSCVWIQEVSPGSLPYAHRTVPNGGVELYCQVGSVPQLVGPQTGPTVEVLAPGTIVVGVRFQPGAAPSVLGMPATELVDLAVGADELWGDAALALGERIASSASPQQAAQELEREGLLVVAFPQHDARMIPASARLHAAVVEQRLTLPDDHELARHASDAIAKHSRRGWRIEKPNPRTNIDAMIALCMALERAEHRPQPVELLGWL